MIGKWSGGPPPDDSSIPGSYSEESGFRRTQTTNSACDRLRRLFVIPEPLDKNPMKMLRLANEKYRHFENGPFPFSLSDVRVVSEYFRSSHEVIIRPTKVLATRLSDSFGDAPFFLMNQRDPKDDSADFFAQLTATDNSKTIQKWADFAARAMLGSSSFKARSSSHCKSVTIVQCPGTDLVICAASINLFKPLF